MPKISELNDEFSSLTGEEIVVMTQGSNSYQISLDNLPFLNPYSTLTVPDDNSAVITLGDGSSPGDSGRFDVVSPTESVILRMSSDPDDTTNDQIALAIGGESAYMVFLYDTDESLFKINVGGSFNIQSDLVLESDYTPTGSDDASYPYTGTIKWDDDNIYVLTNNGWAYAPLTLMDPTP